LVSSNPLKLVHTTGGDLAVLPRREPVPDASFPSGDGIACFGTYGTYMVRRRASNGAVSRLEEMEQNIGGAFNTNNVSGGG